MTVREQTAKSPTESRLAEARFGYDIVIEEVSKLSPGTRVLEIGAGAGYLIARLAKEFPKLHFTGLEPTGDGFSYEHDLHVDAGKETNIDLLAISYEDFRAPHKFDYIFMINVFEHVPNWRHCLDYVSDSLVPGGACDILCPNYRFPYEPHFGLPILINKTISYRLLKPRIAKFEIENACSGLWQSLNFVTFGQVKAHIGQTDLQMEFRRQVIQRMMERLDEDDQFEQRQSWLKIPVKIIQKLNLASILWNWKIFERILPYMHLHLYKPIR